MWLDATRNRKIAFGEYALFCLRFQIRFSLFIKKKKRFFSLLLLQLTKLTFTRESLVPRAKVVEIRGICGDLVQTPFRATEGRLLRVLPVGF